MYQNWVRLMLLAFFMGAITVVNGIQWYQLFTDPTNTGMLNLILTSILGTILAAQAKKRWEECKVFLESLEREPPSSS